MLNSLLRSYWGILLLLATFAVGTIFSFRPNWAEYGYSRGWFMGVRWLFDATLTRLPVVWFYVFLAALPFAGWWFVARSHHAPPRVPKWAHRLLRLVSFVGLLVSAFMVLWGFNYRRIPLDQQLGLSLSPLGMERVITATKAATRLADSLRTLIPAADTNALVALPADLDQQLRQCLESVLTAHGYPVAGRVRIRHLRPQGVLLRIGTAGFYWSLTGEGHIDAGLHPLQKPFTIAHEMAHGYGIANESECNFLAYLACQRATDPTVRYAGQLSYWRYIAGEYKARAPEEYAVFRTATLSRGMHNDLAAIYANNDKFPEYLPAVREATYDTYLHLQGISDGIANYNRVVLLVEAYEKSTAQSRR